MSSPAKAVEAANAYERNCSYAFLFWTSPFNDESARDVSRDARFPRIGAFIEHWPASGSALRGESYKRPEVFFLVERVRVRTKVVLEMSGSLRREQRTGM